MKIVQKRKIWFLLSGLLIITSIVSLYFWKLNWGIDFVGGSLLELEFAEGAPDTNEFREYLKAYEPGIGTPTILETEENRVILRMKETDKMWYDKLTKDLEKDYKAKEYSFESIGPTIGNELRRRALWSIVGISICIIFFLSYAFRKVPHPLSSWQFGVTAVTALVHDVLIVVGLFSILGHFRGVEVDTLFATALLTTLGFSVHDTIVIFDRIRENLLEYSGEDFEEIANKSVNQALVRSLNTSFTTFLVLLALLLFGGTTIHYLALALICGVIIGTYSSDFIAVPLLVLWHRFAEKRR
ncbi:protein translocase subunit SecF [bacterium (Candidatus Torokbacteria) CG_4_10_14_0_2_um_filter_35_8]|nr:MAG: protein translocase subunit SecF [bacterium (Candidatus Torokbacteria) CG_4_10_14_0_2_um_filter_35_8]